MFKITSIKTKKIKSDNSKILGIAKVIIDNCFIIGDIRIVQGKPDKGIFIAFPNRKQKDGKFVDICHPLNKEIRKYFEQEIIAKFIAGDHNESNI